MPTNEDKEQNSESRERAASVDSSGGASSGSGVDDSRASIDASTGSDRGSMSDIPRGRAATMPAPSTGTGTGDSDEGGTRPRSASAPTGTTPTTSQKKPFETEVAVTHQLHDKTWVNVTAKVESEEKRLGDNSTVQDSAEVALTVKTSADAGISSNGLVAQAELEVKGIAEIASKIKTKIGDKDATVDAKLAAAAKASAGAQALLGRAGVALKGEAKAEVKATSSIDGGVQLSDRHNVKGGVQAEAFAKAKAVAEAKLSAEGAKLGTELSAGAGVKVGPKFNLSEGESSVNYQPTLVLGKVGAGADVAVSNEPNNVGVKVKVGAELGIGVEINVEANYNTEQVSAAGRKAAEALQNKINAFDGLPTNNHDDRSVIIHNATNIPGTIVNNFGKELTEQGSRQGGVVGTLHQGVGYVSQGAGYLLEGAGTGAGYLASGVTTGAVAIYGGAKTTIKWVGSLFS